MQIQNMASKSQSSSDLLCEVNQGKQNMSILSLTQDVASVRCMNNNSSPIPLAALFGYSPDFKSKRIIQAPKYIHQPLLHNHRNITAGQAHCKATRSLQEDNITQAITRQRTNNY